MFTQKKLLVWGIFFLFLFVIFSFWIHLGQFVGTDLKITENLQAFLPRIVDTPFSLLSLVGSLEMASIVLFIIWAMYRRMNYIFVLIAFGIFHIIETFGKAYVTHLPPPHNFFRYDLSLYFPSANIAPGFSYPSGHAGRTAFLSILIILIIWNSKKLKRTWKIVFIFCILIFDLVMFVSRIYLGEHWASDVIGGMLIGFSFGIFSFIFLSSKSIKLPKF